METSAITYRVADFLKKHPPFTAVDEADLLQLAQGGRVRFHEANDYILWHGEPNRMQVFVIQQGTVSLWDEAGPRAELRDVRGPGDMLGIEQFNGADVYLHSARASTDVVLYAFPALDFEALVLKHPSASRYVAAHGQVTADYQPADGAREPHRYFLQECAAGKTIETCDASSTVREVAGRMLGTGADALAITDTAGGTRGIVTTASLIKWIANGGGDAGQPIAAVLPDLPSLAVPVDTSLTDGILLMAEEHAEAVTITSDGTPGGPLCGVITARDLLPIFGDQPLAILERIRSARTTHDLRELNRRVRAFALQHLTGAGALEWVSRFTHAADVGILRRLIALADPVAACWCLCGSAGRSESVTARPPDLAVIVDDEAGIGQARAAYDRVAGALAECEYLESKDLLEPSFAVASLGEWRDRFEGWVREPIPNEMYRYRPLFDLRPVTGPPLARQLEPRVMAAVDSGFLHVLANDCLANLPPLTFFQDAVVDESGDESAVFRLERTALLPLVDVGRVFAFAARQVFQRSTLQRFESARVLLPDHAPIFRDAADVLRIVLWQQGRVGISQGTDGTSLPAALLSRYDRQLLKGGFRSILRLLEFTADMKWLTTI